MKTIITLIWVNHVIHCSLLTLTILQGDSFANGFKITITAYETSQWRFCVLARYVKCLQWLHLCAYLYFLNRMYCLWVHWVNHLVEYIGSLVNCFAVIISTAFHHTVNSDHYILHLISILSHPSLKIKYNVKKYKTN